MSAGGGSTPGTPGKSNLGKSAPALQKTASDISLASSTSSRMTGQMAVPDVGGANGQLCSFMLTAS